MFVFDHELASALAVCGGVPSAYGQARCAEGARNEAEFAEAERN